MGRTLTSLICPHCKHMFFAPLTKVIRGKRKYCSKQCAGSEVIKRGLLPRAMAGEWSHIYRRNIKKIHKKWTDESKHPRWKGDSVGYWSLHLWVSKHRGRPKTCEHCGLSDPKRKYYWANKSHKYKRDLSDWIRLCCSCHRKYDNAGKKGWETRKRNAWLKAVK